jgi:hypothetical protein
MTKRNNEIQECEKKFLSVLLPPKDYLVYTFPRSTPKTPIYHFLHSVEDYRNWFYQISLLFDSENKFTLSNKKEFLEDSFAEKYAFALYQNGKINLSFDLFSVFPKKTKISKIVNQDGEIIYPDFGLHPDEFGIWGIETFIKVCCIKQQTEKAEILALKIIDDIEKTLSEKIVKNKTLYKALVYAYNLVISNKEKGSELRMHFEHRKVRNLRLLNQVWGIKQNLSDSDILELWEDVFRKTSPEIKKISNASKVDPAQLTRKYNV